MDPQRRGRAFTLVALLLCVAACREVDPWSDRGVQEFVVRTVPPGATLVGSLAPTRDQSGISAEWEISTGMTWDAYAQWIKDRLAKDFSAGPGVHSPMSFRKVLPGDVVSLRVERLSSALPLHVRVTLRAGPF